MTNIYTNKQRSFFCLLPYLAAVTFLVVGLLLVAIERRQYRSG